MGATLLLPAVLLLAVGAEGLVVRTRNAGRFGGSGWMGLGASGVGAAMVIISNLVQAVFFSGDFSLMPVFVIPGGLIHINPRLRPLHQTSTRLEITVPTP